MNNNYIRIKNFLRPTLILVLKRVLTNSVLFWTQIFSLVVFSISWIHYFVTGTLEVDIKSIEPIFLRVVLCSIVALTWTRLCIAMNKSFQNNQIDISVRFLRVNIYLSLAIQFLTLPIFSNDAFSMLAYSQGFIQGQDIYKVFEARFTDYANYINPIYLNMPCMYGPLSVLELCIPFLIGIKTIPLQLLFAKIVFLINAIVYIEVSLRIIKSFNNSFKFLILLFPIWIIQGLGQLHNDLLGLTWLSLSILSMIRGKWSICAICLTLSILCKITFAIFIILPLLYLYKSDNPHLKKYFTFLAIFCSSFLILGTVCFIPFSKNLLSILEPINLMKSLRPSSTFSDILSHVLMIYNSNFRTNSYFSTLMFKYLGVIFLVGYGIYYFNNKLEEDSWVKLILVVFTTLIFVISHRFLPWYLMSYPLLVIFLNKDKSWVNWLIVIAWISFFQDIAIVLNTDFILGQIIMILSTVMVVIFHFYLIKQRYRLHE